MIEQAGNYAAAWAAAANYQSFGLPPPRRAMNPLNEQILQRVMMDEPTDTVEERWCGHCEKETRQECHDSNHERDSSGDSRYCLECGWRYSGLTGKWEKPRVLAK